MKALKHIKIGSRKSHLARYQAYLVGQALQKQQPDLKIEFFFKESLGDINLSDPLWKMPEKGVFTEDFLQDLEQSRVDLVVHSWKDLPTAERSTTFIAATLPRAETRDLLLVKKTSRPKKHWKILCSSPRRQRNIASLLAWALPAPSPGFDFENVRGNIPTRIRKLLEGESDALVLAKAALDRLLGWREITSMLNAEESSDFQSLENTLRGQLKLCDWMLLPVSEDPPAAAQGALAIEVGNQASGELRALLEKINCPRTFTEVLQERKILASYGGGCHQAIGAWCKQIEESTLVSIKGITDSQEVLSTWALQNSGKNKFGGLEYFPKDATQDSLTDSVDIEHKAIPTDCDLWVSKARALPQTFSPSSGQLLWSAGLQTWKKLAARGLWVNGSAESLGDHFPARIDELLGRKTKFLRLTHWEASKNDAQSLGTYKIILKDKLPDLSKYQSFFWSSGSVFEWVLKANPALKDAHHACGLGKSYESIKKSLPATNPPTAFLNFEEWKAAHIKNSNQM